MNRELGAAPIKRTLSIVIGVAVIALLVLTLRPVLTAGTGIDLRPSGQEASAIDEGTRSVTFDPAARNWAPEEIGVELQWSTLAVRPGSDADDDYLSVGRYLSLAKASETSEHQAGPNRQHSYLRAKLNVAEPIWASFAGMSQAASGDAGCSFAPALAPQEC